MDKPRTYSDPMAGAGAGGGGVPPPRSRSLERFATASSKQTSESKVKQTVPSDLKPYQGPPRPRAYSEPKTGVADPYESYYRSRSVEGEFYRNPYRAPPPRPYDIRQQRLAGRYHELRVIDEGPRRPPDNEIDIIRMLQMIGIGIAIGIILLGSLNLSNQLLSRNLS
uniref:Uncharacterized protein n=1 Tax=Glossina morsitans morsitans TaxID=37546 RepID=A0A1B0FEK8_GLOMM